MLRIALSLCLVSSPVLACLRDVDPTPAELFVRRATRQLSDRDYEGALKTARTVVAAEGKAPTGFTWAARMDVPTKANVKAARRVAALALVRLARHTEARAWLEKALAEDPDDPQLNCRMAEVEIAEGKDRAALDR